MGIFLIILRTKKSLYFRDVEFCWRGERVKTVKMTHVLKQTYYFFLDMVLRVRSIRGSNQVFAEHLLRSLDLHMDSVENNKG